MQTPSDLDIESALWVARTVDESGNDAPALEATLRAAVTRGQLSTSRLSTAQSLLLECGLLIESPSRVQASAALRVIAQLGDDAALSMLRRLVEQSISERGAPSHLSDEQRAAVGAAGEMAVMTRCADDLIALGRYDLAAQVQRVSLVSDALGYDVEAPVMNGESRLLEVKSSTIITASTFRFYLSRNEFDVGRRRPRSWALVACEVQGNDVTISGWCRVADLERYLPEDRNGRWTEALVHLPVKTLRDGLPPAID